VVKSRDEDTTPGLRPHVRGQSEVQDPVLCPSKLSNLEVSNVLETNGNSTVSILKDAGCYHNTWLKLRLTVMSAFTWLPY
jgi:hypothetical protein